MENYQLTEDIKLFWVQAASFPDGVLEAFKKLRGMLPTADDRTLYGLSKPEKGVIVYRAAVEESFPGEAEKLGCDTYIMRKGNYRTQTIHDWQQHMDQFKVAFDRLLDTPELDHTAFCVEWYKSDQEVVCMVKLA